MLLGRAYRELGNPAAAVTAFETVIAQYPRDVLFGEALLEQGRTKFLSGDIPGAISHYLSIADRYGYLPDAAEEDLYWSYHFLSGALTLSLSQTGRIDRLSNGLCKSSDFESIARRMAPFIASGFEKLCKKGRVTKSRSHEVTRDPLTP